MTGGLTVEQGGPFAFSIGDPLVIDTTAPGKDTFVAKAASLAYQGDVIHEISSTLTLCFGLLLLCLQLISE